MQSAGLSRASKNHYKTAMKNFISFHPEFFVMLPRAKFFLVLFTRKIYYQSFWKTLKMITWVRGILRVLDYELAGSSGYKGRQGDAADPPPLSQLVGSSHYTSVTNQQ